MLITVIPSSSMVVYLMMWGFERQIVQQILLYSKMSRPAVGPSPLHIYCIPQVLSPRVEKLGNKVYHSLLCVAKAKNEGLYTSACFPCMSAWHQNG
jgi:hypothetical protein